MQGHKCKFGATEQTFDKQEDTDATDCPVGLFKVYNSDYFDTAL